MRSERPRKTRITAMKAEASEGVSIVVMCGCGGMLVDFGWGLIGGWLGGTDQAH